MHTHLIFWPVLAQVLLTISMFGLLGWRKAQALKAGGIDLKAVKLNNNAWPDSVVQVGNNINNQFETPVLFYILAVALFMLGAVDTVVIALAWLYVGLRVAHAVIHVTTNRVPMRMKVFTAGMLVLIILAGMLGWQLTLL
ncbi:MAPEG family protein [Salinispirillum sp. LH 10-3-1]|uniref:MAPEG family protein n=1 Tax=Salinispirillum sp. LH 10-3-1 TaxID=2952525 RepID=A0AB38YIA2_9GAMM